CSLFALVAACLLSRCTRTRPPVYCCAATDEYSRHITTIFTICNYTILGHIVIIHTICNYYTWTHNYYICYM
ncbi:hypothetical protein, partial [Clostridioides difficile]|uniref:hypothetical protein n=1 Tax=Clostridioides difficile TaxID=1496 RepID=UPI001A9A53E5